MTNKAGEQSPAYFLPYLNPLLNPFPVFTGLGEKVKTRYPLRDNGFQWSCWADLNRRPHPYQGCALPTELQQRMATRKGLEPSTSGVTGRRSNQLNYRAIAVSKSRGNLQFGLAGAEGFEPSALGFGDRCSTS